MVKPKSKPQKKHQYSQHYQNKLGLIYDEDQDELPIRSYCGLGYDAEAE